MQVLIELPDIDDNEDCFLLGQIRMPNNGDAFGRIVVEAIKHGMPLPKGHGRLVDIDKWFKDTFPKAELNSPGVDNLKAYPYWKTDITGIAYMVSQAPAIIERDGEVKK